MKNKSLHNKKGCDESCITSNTTVQSNISHDLHNFWDGNDVKGVDEEGRFYNSHDELIKAQELYRSAFYDANRLYWSSGGYNGHTDDEAMVGDTGSIKDAEEGLIFLDKYLNLLHFRDSKFKNRWQFNHAVDVGAGVGRISKLILLKRFRNVTLVEGDQSWSRQSKMYLGKKRSTCCQFFNQQLDNLSESKVREWGEPVDLIWIQWTLQYLTDVDVIKCLKLISVAIRPKSGIMIVKENRPYGVSREDRFQMDLPWCDNQRYDITRSDYHHRLLFHLAGLKVDFVEKGDETFTYALMVA